MTVFGAKNRNWLIFSALTPKKKVNKKIIKNLKLKKL